MAGKNTKICKTCLTEKGISEFYFAGNYKGRQYISSECKICAKERGNTYYAANKEKAKANGLKWRQKNPDYMKEFSRKYRLNNPDKSRTWGREYARRNRLDPVFRLQKNFSTVMQHHLKGRKGGKRWEDLAGYTIKDLTVHLESLFLDGMSWGNYGKWHVDHIIPASIFNFSSHKDVDFKRCWALDNLQPLWATDNSSKKDKIKEPFQPSLRIAI